MATVTKWDWQASNGNATAQATVAAYNALRHGGRTDAFSSIVWNDLVNKLSAQRLSWGDTAWLDKPIGIQDTRMGHRAIMTAQRFNAVVNNMPTIKEWPWGATLGRTEIRKGDRCYGLYFILLTDALNHWIDTIPIPFLVDISAETVAALEAQVCTALPFKLDGLRQMSYFYESSALVRPDPSIRFGGAAHFTHTGSNTVTVFSVGDTGINVFFHHAHHVTYSLYPSVRVVIDLPMQTSSEATISFGGCDFVVINLPMHTSAQTLVRPSPTTGLGGAVDYLLDHSIKVGFSQSSDLMADLVMNWHSEPRIRERDSEPFNVFNDTHFSIVAPVQAPQGDRISSNIPSLLNMSVTPGMLSVSNVKINLPVLLSMQTAPALLSRDFIMANLCGEVGISTLAVRAIGAHTGATLANQIAIKLGMYAFDQMSTGAEIALQSLFAAEAKTPDIIPYIVNMQEAVNITANACANSFADFSVQLLEYLGITTVATLMQGAHTGATLAGLMGIESSITVETPTDTAFVLQISSQLVPNVALASDTPSVQINAGIQFNGGLFISMADTSGALHLFLSAQHEGFSEVSLSSVFGVGMALDTSHTGTAFLSLDEAIEFAGELHSQHEGTATFALATYTLASELEDVLVSDLDNELITNVEFSIH